MHLLEHIYKERSAKCRRQRRKEERKKLLSTFLVSSNLLNFKNCFILKYLKKILCYFLPWISEVHPWVTQLAGGRSGICTQIWAAGAGLWSYLDKEKSPWYFMVLSRPHWTSLFLFETQGVWINIIFSKVPFKSNVILSLERFI